jgi:hypothetical protein
VTRPYKIMLAVFGFLLLATSSFVCQRVADRGRFTGAYSSYGSGPKGTRALYLLAEQLGLHPARWSQDLAALPDGGGVLVALGDCNSGMARPLSRYEDQELADWVEQGGVLFVGGARHYLPEHIGVAFASEAGCDAAWHFVTEHEGDGQTTPLPSGALPPDAGAGETADAGIGAEASGGELAQAGLDRAGGDDNPEDVVWTAPADDALRGLDNLPMRHPGQLVLEPKANARVILSLPGEDDSERPVGVIVRHGQGRVIALASASMLQNRALASADGGLLFARLMAAYAGHGPVLFDEYHLGVGERRSLMRYLRQVGAAPFMLQLALAVLLLLWRTGARFGGVREPQAPVAAGTASFVFALGGLFSRSGDAASAAQILGKQARARIAAYHHVPQAGTDQLAHALSEKGLTQAAEAVRRTEVLERQVAGRPGSLAACSRALDAVVARACRYG